LAPTLTRDPKDFWSGIVFIAAGLAAVVIARDYSMGSATRMGPAYFPTVLGGLLVLIGLIAVVRSLVTTGPPVGRFAWKALALVTGPTVLFGFLLRGAGLGPSLLLLVVVSAIASRKFAWGPTVALALGLSLFSVLLFVKALGLPIPVVGHWLGG
jgi:putative tricarboxylic transport membrane protein